MIYDLPEPSSPISQGDIFIGVPILDLPVDHIPTIEDQDDAKLLTWEEFASVGQTVVGVVAVRPTIAIVGIQECDALRAPNITLFEVRPFRDVERKSKDTNKPSKWVPIITQHARVNQKWFYLPTDERLGFFEKMGVDFLTSISVPRVALERLIGFRKGRLNETARQHFRERLAEFFRRYAYDEWYPLTREELTEYQKSNPDAAPFPWQKDVAEAASAIRQQEEVRRKGFLDYLHGSHTSMAELTNILSALTTEIKVSTIRINEQVKKINELAQNPSPDAVGKLNTYCQRIAGDVNAFSKKVEEVNIRLESTIGNMTENILGYINWASSNQQIDPEEVVVFREQM